ncbi:uncharacterized protein [Zea mays]|uniref:Uncharacterized protein n=1 Tax=Zea mays TaxID=4577 RepID=A0A804M5Y3_MAIZE|nr:uncharacterized protein LOC100193385 isoform X5 [Zea mays]XP_023156482.1 uncharacterized protein LOC100193385 isoform X5 [Zea mays]|eukprot:XP_023156477.1 uncharacterized protein LOC100193385 isoform X4 [Zea mays]
MNQEAKDSRPSRSPSEPNLFLQWGSRKRLRCVKTRDDGSPSPSPSEGLRRAIPRATRPLLGADIAAFRRPSTFNRRKSDSLVNEYRHSMALSLEKDKYYTTRGSPFDGNGFDFGSIAEEKGTTALPRFFVALSNKEKEEDFMAMKGCKLPQRPKKRPKLMQKCLLMVSPGAWLSDLSHERYEVREKKSSKKRARGLKALTMESDSE